MIRVGHIISTTFDKAKRLVATMRINGKVKEGTGDVRTPVQTSSFGFESNPTNGKVGLYVQSGKDGKYFLIGTINTECITKPGESRMFSTNADKDFKAQIHLTDAGNMLLGDKLLEADYNNFATKFNEMKTEFNKLKEDHNVLAQKWNAFCGSYSPGSPSTVGTPPSLAASNVNLNNSNIDNAKHSKIKYSE